MNLQSQYYLIHIRIPLRISQHIECSIQVVEHPHDLHGSLMVGVPGAVVGEPHDAAEEEGDGVVPTCWDGTLVTELGSHADWED